MQLYDDHDVQVNGHKKIKIDTSHAIISQKSAFKLVKPIPFRSTLMQKYEGTTTNEETKKLET